MALEGSIKEFGLAEIFQLISLQKKSGVLTVHHAGINASITFYMGQVCHADSSNKAESEKIGRRLIAADKLKEIEIKEALGNQAKTGHRIGKILVDLGYISSNDLKDVLQIQINDVIFQILRWKDGSYQFDVLDEEINNDHAVLVQTDLVLMEGVRKLDEWPNIESIIPSENIVYSQSYHSDEAETLFSSLSSEELEIFNLIDGHRDVNEIINMTQHSEFDVFKILATLHVSGLIKQICSSGKPEETLKREGKDTKRLWTVVQVAILLFTISFLLILMPVREMIGINEIFEVTELSRKISVRKELTYIHQSIRYYFLMKNDYPVSLEILNDEGYLKDDLLNDGWGNSFIYERDISFEGGYKLYSSGPDGVTRTLDDIF